MTKTRRHHIAEKIPTSATGLRGAIFVHIDYIEQLGTKQVVDVRVSEKRKDGSTMDLVLDAVSDVITRIIREEINPTNVVDLKPTE